MALGFQRGAFQSPGFQQGEIQPQNLGLESLYIRPVPRTMFVFRALIFMFVWGAIWSQI